MHELEGVHVLERHQQLLEVAAAHLQTEPVTPAISMNKIAQIAMQGFHDQAELEQRRGGVKTRVCEYEEEGGGLT
jgi:hypothetical protein